MSGSNKISVGDNKIDNQATLGLAGVSNSLAYRVHEIEKHLHNYEKWFGAAASASGETHVADRMDGAITPFTLTAGNNAFGSWVQILGSSDTPVTSGSVKYDIHRVMVTATNSTNPYIVQIVCGESADIATKLAAQQYTEFGYISASNNNDSGITDVLEPRQLTGCKVWARCACVGGNGTTLAFYFGIHEYAG